MNPHEYELLVESLRTPRRREVRPTDRPCAPPGDGIRTDMGSALIYSNSGPLIEVEEFEPLFAGAAYPVLVACATRAARMLLPLWNEWRASVLPFIPEREEGYDAARWHTLSLWRDRIDESYNESRERALRPMVHWSDPPRRLLDDSRTFVLWVLDWPIRLMRQADEWMQDRNRNPYPTHEAGTIFNTLREYLIRLATGLAARDSEQAGWDSLEMSVLGLSSVYFWLARSLTPSEGYRQEVMRNDVLHCITFCAPAIAWRVESVALRGMDHGMTRRLFSEPRGEMIPARPGRFVHRPPEVEQRARNVLSGFYFKWWKECRCGLAFREGTSVTLEGPPPGATLRGPSREAYDPYPEPPTYFTTVNLIEQLGFGKVDPVKDLLGVGGFGEAWQLPDDSVLKFTTSPAEMHCVEYIFTNDLRSRHLPRIIAYGHLAPGTAYWSSRLAEEDEYLEINSFRAAELNWQGRGPTFWYVREVLDDIRPGDSFNTYSPVVDLWTRHGILPMGIERPSNWGKRKGSKDLVLRDLACSTPEAHFANRTREDAVVQHAAEIHPEDIPSYLEDEMRGDSTLGGPPPSRRLLIPEGLPLPPGGGRRLEIPGFRWLRSQTFSTPAAPPRTVEVYLNTRFHAILVAAGLVQPDATHPSCEFVLVPGGEFVMGSDTGEPDERPAHRVEVQPFLLARTPLIRTIWLMLVQERRGVAGDWAVPQTEISWHDVVGWCNAHEMRMPSEAEWEYACRAGSTTEYCFGNDVRLLDEWGWYGSNTSRVQPVGLKRPNAFGLLDMHGNVWEWCQDAYKDSYQGAPTDGSAVTNPDTSDRVFRGYRSGSWYGYAAYCRSAYRNRLSPGGRSLVLGFRPAVSLGDVNFRWVSERSSAIPLGADGRKHSLPEGTIAGPKGHKGKQTPIWLTPEYGRIVSLISGPQGNKTPQHLVVQVRTPDGLAYLDGDGLQTAAKLLHRWETQEAVAQPQLIPYVEVDARASCNPYEDRVQELLPEYLAKLGNSVGWGLLPLQSRP